MQYKVVFLPAAEKQLQTLEPLIVKRLIKKLQWIVSQPDPLRYARPLKQAKIGDARFRIGEYRIIVVVDQKLNRIGIAAIGHRRDIYR